MTTIRTRFAPSPTGNIHLGNGRTAIFSALFAKHHEGVFVLRIEDTDAVRSEEVYTERLQEKLKWLGINWQEGPEVGGEYGPYWQSQRQAIYEKYYDILKEKKLMYACFCTEQDLAVERKIQLGRGLPPRYSGKCKKLSQEIIESRMASGELPAWRFVVPENHEIVFKDVVKGEQRFKSQEIGDFIIRRKDLTSPFLFCNAIDDALMKITHVLRGEDHVANTPRQIMILEALHLPAPHYGHASLILGDDGTPLSKRHGSFSVEQLEEQGYLPGAIINYLARLGHTMDHNELLSFDALAKQFDLKKLSKSPARFDTIQLNFWQKTAVSSQTIVSFWRWVGETIANQVPLASQDKFAELMKANAMFKEEVSDWAKIFFHDNITINNTDAVCLHEAGEQFFVVAEQAVDQFGTDFARVLDEMKNTLGVKGRKLFMPIRIALTGREHGPDLQSIADMLGKEKMKHRFGRALRSA